MILGPISYLNWEGFETFAFADSSLSKFWSSERQTDNTHMWLALAYADRSREARPVVCQDKIKKCPDVWQSLARGYLRCLHDWSGGTLLRSASGNCRNRRIRFIGSQPPHPPFAAISTVLLGVSMRGWHVHWDHLRC